MSTGGTELRRPPYVRVLLVWALTGLVGGHHFYLGRHLHGLLWLTSFGGFGVGWLLDLFRLKRFIDDACTARPPETQLPGGGQGRPGSSSARGGQHFVAQRVLGAWYSSLARFACNAWGFRLLARPASLCALFLAVWAVDNCSRTRGSSLEVVGFAGSVAAAVAHWTDGEHSYITFAAQLASFATTGWRDTSAGSRDVALSGEQALAVGAVLAILLASLAVKLAAEWQHRLDSEADMLSWVLGMFGWEVHIRGWSSSFMGDDRGGSYFSGQTFGSHRGGAFGGGRFADEFRQRHSSLPPRGYSSLSQFEATKLLGLGRYPTAQQVKDAHRTLSLQHHPDKVNPSERAAAEAMQVQLNAAREVLMQRIPRD